MNMPLNFLSRTVGVFFFAAVLSANTGRCETALVYDTGSEILTSGDFNGDGIADILVLDKLTGNARVGYLDPNGVIAWSAPLVSGVENVSGAAVGPFLTAGTDALGVTASGLNLVNLVSLANSNNAATPVAITPSGIGPHALVTLLNPLGIPSPAAPALLVASSDNSASIEQMEWPQIAGGLVTPGGSFPETGPFDRGNALSLGPPDSPTFAAGLVRGQDADRFDLLQFTNGAGGILLSLTNLPAGADYAFGNFNGESLPHIAFYQPGASNLTIAALLSVAGGLQIGTNLIVPFAEPLQRVFYLPPAAAGSFLVEFADGVQAIQFSGDTAAVGAVYRGGMADSNNVFTGLVPLANGHFVLLDATAGAAASTHAQVLSFDGTNFSSVSSSALPAISTRSTRANVWLFQTEPFVNRDPGFVASFSSPDWSDQVGGLPGAFSVLEESDGGNGNGLGNFTTNQLGAPPAGANFGLPNQVADSISVFSYAPPRAPQPVAISIAPPPGTYSGPIQISFATLPAGDSVYYRAGAADGWHAYAAAFGLTNDAAVEYYSLSSSGARSRLLTANYSFANNATAATNLNLINGLAVTNSTPPGRPSGPDVALSQNGTVFYGRKNAAGGAIWAINLDGSGDTYITTGARPRVSRDGHYMAFMRGTNVFQAAGGDIWLRDLTTGGEWLFFANHAQIVGYDWDLASPPKLILDYGCGFWQAPLSNPPAIFPLASDCYSYAPAVNPVDGRVAFFDASANAGTGIDVGPAGGGLAQHLDPTVMGSRWPAWSPNGARLSFSYLNNYYATYGMADLYTINPDGTALAQITAFTSTSDGFLYGAIWTPAGNCLLGAGSIYGTNGLWRIPLTSDGQHCDCPAKLLPTSDGDPIDFAGSVIAAPAATVAKPGLFIRLDANAVVVYWSTNYQGYSLQATAGLDANLSWGDISGPYFQNGAYYEYHEARTALAATRFFRLQYPGTIILQPWQPKIFVQVQAGELVLTWHTNYVGYTLEATTNLIPPFVWSPLSPTVVNTNGQLEFRLSSSLPREFFRLRW